MADAEPIIKIPGGPKKRRGGIDSGPLSKSVPTSFYSNRCPPAPRHRPLSSKEDPDALQLPPPSPLDDHKIKEHLLLGRSLTNTTPSQLLYPSSVPSRFPAKRLRDLSLTPKKPDILQTDDLEASPSSSVHSSKGDTAYEDAPNVGSQPIVGSLSSTLRQILEEDSFRSNDPVSVLTDAHDLEENGEDRNDIRQDGIFELEDD